MYLDNNPSSHTTCGFCNDSQNLVNLLKIIQEKLDWVNINRVLADDQNDHFVDLSGTQIERNKKRTRNTLRFTCITPLKLDICYFYLRETTTTYWSLIVFTLSLK